MASRTPRYRMLALILPERSDTAGELRQRYGVNVHQGRPITMDTLDDVERAVRSELRNEKPGKWLTALRKEPLWASDTHICDTDQAGWRLWGITSRYRLASPLMRDERTVNSTMFRARPMLREQFVGGRFCVEAPCSHANGELSPEPECECGVHYALAVKYINDWTADFLEQPWCEAAGYKEDVYALSFGVAQSVLPDRLWPGGCRRAKRYMPTRIVLPDGVPAEWGKGFDAATASMSTPTGTTRFEQTSKGLNALPAPNWRASRWKISSAHEGLRRALKR